MTLKKLLVLDVNGLLIDTYFHKEPLPEGSPDARVGNFYVYKRPFCEEFLQFCLENFVVGIWSSAREYNVNNLVDYIFRDAKERLAFSWHQSDCTDVGLKAPDNEWKPLFMKELSKLWRKEKLSLPWTEGDYGPSNTLLVDDTPYKAVLNPPNTAIFPRSYTARNHGDNFLGGALRSYLEGIRDAVSVQIYVENNPLGEPSITPESPLWSHVSKVLLRVQRDLNNVSDEIAQVLPVEAVSDDMFARSRRKKWRRRKWHDHSGPPQLMNNDTGPFDNFPSEAIELQFSENVLPLPDEARNSAVLEQAYKLDQSGNESNVLSGLQKADERQFRDEKPGLESLHIGDCKMTRESSTPPQQKFRGAFEGAAEGPMERGHLCTAEEPADRNANAGSNTDNTDPEHVHSKLITDHGNENGQKLCGNSGLNPSKSNWMLAGVDDECHDEKQELIIPRDENTVCTTKKNLFYSDRSRDEQGRFEGRPVASYDKKKYHSRDIFDYSQNCKRQRGVYHNGSKRDHDNGHYSYGGGRCYQDRNRGSTGHDQNWKRERGCHHGATTNMPDQRRHINKSGHKIYEADEGRANRGNPFNGYANHSQLRHDRRVDSSAEYARGNTRAPWNSVIDSNYSSQPHRSSGDFDHVQGGFPSSHQWHNGFEPMVAYENYNAHPKYMEDWNMQGWHLDLTENHPQRTRDWSLQGWRPDSAKRGGGRSSKPFRSAGAYQQSNRRGGGASRLPYKSNGASAQWDHNNSDGWRKDWASRGFSKKRQN